MCISIVNQYVHLINVYSSVHLYTCRRVKNCLLRVNNRVCLDSQSTHRPSHCTETATHQGPGTTSALPTAFRQRHGTGTSLYSRGCVTGNHRVTDRHQAVHLPTALPAAVDIVPGTAADVCE